MTDKLFAIRERHDAVEFSINRSVDGGHGHLTIDEAEAAHEDRAELLNAVTLAETARDLARKNAREGWSAASNAVDRALRFETAVAELRRALRACTEVLAVQYETRQRNGGAGQQAYLRACQALIATKSIADCECCRVGLHGGDSGNAWAGQTCRNCGHPFTLKRP